MDVITDRDPPWWSAISDLALSVIALWPTLAFRRVVTPRLRQRVGALETARLICAIERRHEKVPVWPGRGAVGVRLLMAYLRWNVATWDSLGTAGWMPSDAGALIEAANWDLFGPLTRSLYRLTRLCHSAPVRRGALVYKVLFRSLFARPFRSETPRHTEGFAFDVTVCPIAEYCGAFGMPELASHAACSLDHRMAALWDHRLRRATTIASGHDRCRFRFIPLDQAN